MPVRWTGLPAWTSCCAKRSDWRRVFTTSKGAVTTDPHMPPRLSGGAAESVSGARGASLTGHAPSSDEVDGGRGLGSLCRAAQRRRRRGHGLADGGGEGRVERVRVHECAQAGRVPSLSNASKCIPRGKDSNNHSVELRGGGAPSARSRVDAPRLQPATAPYRPLHQAMALKIPTGGPGLFKDGYNAGRPLIAPRRNPEHAPPAYRAGARVPREHALTRLHVSRCTRASRRPSSGALLPLVVGLRPPHSAMHAMLTSLDCLQQHPCRC